MGKVKYVLLLLVALVILVVSTPFAFVYFQARAIVIGFINTWRYANGFIGQVKWDIRHHWEGRNEPSDRKAGNSGGAVSEESIAVHGRDDSAGADNGRTL